MPPAGRTEQDQADDHGDPFRATHRWFGFPESAHPVQDKSSTPRGEPTTPLGVQIPLASFRRVVRRWGAEAVST